MFRKYGVSSSYLPTGFCNLPESRFRKYGVSSSYLPYGGVHARPPNFAGTAFRAVTYLAGKIPRVHKGFAGMEFLAVTYQSDMTRSAEYCFTGMAFRAVTCPYLPWDARASVLQVWRFEQLLTSAFHDRLDLGLRRHRVSSSYTLGTSMDLPTLILRRYRTSSSCLPNFKHRAYCDRPHLRQCSRVTSYLCLSICSFTHLPFGATIWPVAFHCNLKTEAPQFRMYCVSDTRSVEGEGIVRHA